MNRSVIIGIAGGSGAGKTTIVRRVARALGEPNVTVLEHERYYRNHARPRPGEVPDFNFDHPRSFDTGLLVQHLRALRDGQTVQAPVFDCALGARTAETTTVRPARAILVEGILVLADEALRSLMDLKVFVDADADTRFIRRLEHDMARRGRTRSAVIDQYLTMVKPMHVEFVEPTRRYADLILDGGGEVEVAVERVVGKLDNWLAG
jgi:uridine kinase